MPVSRRALSTTVRGLAVCGRAALLVTLVLGVAGCRGTESLAQLDAGRADAAHDAPGDAPIDAPLDAPDDANGTCPSAVLAGQIEFQPGTAVRDEGLPGQESRLAVLPLTTVVFDGSESTAPNGPVDSYVWTLAAQPPGSTDQLLEEAGGERARLFTSLAGVYRVELQVRNDQNELSCNTAAVEILVLAPDSLHIQLVWTTPADPNEMDTDGSDLDVHLLDASSGGAWNTLPGDCFPLNPNPDWGVTDFPHDNPRLDRDDTDGAGPENINVSLPELDHVYRVGVDYHDDHGFGSAFARVRIYAHGELVLDLSGRELTDTGQFWYVADVHWTPSATADIATVDQIGTGFP